MDRSIRYVREHKVAPLLNDMLTHLLLTQSSDPLASLIAYLEKKQAKLVSAKAQSPDRQQQGDAATAAQQQSSSSDQSSVVLEWAASPLPNTEEDLLSEVLRGERLAQLALERVATNFPKSAASFHDIIDRVQRNSDRISSLAAGLLQSVRKPQQPSGERSPTVRSKRSPSVGVETAIMLPPASGVDEAEVNLLLAEAMSLDRQLKNMLNHDNRAALDDQFMRRALQQQEMVISLLSELA